MMGKSLLIKSNRLILLYFYTTLGVISVAYLVHCAIIHRIFSNYSMVEGSHFIMEPSLKGGLHFHKRWVCIDPLGKAVECITCIHPWKNMRLSKVNMPDGISFKYPNFEMVICFKTLPPSTNYIVLYESFQPER
jgi:hypothetical protein